MVLTKLDMLTELKKRGVAVEGLQQLVQGFEGEKWVYETLLEYGQPNWKILRNIWLDGQGKFECDLAVFTNAGMYAFEIKNYNGHLSIQNGVCLLNRMKIGYHPVYQAQKSKVNIENIMHKRFPRMNVQGALIFAGEHQTLDLEDTVDDIQILMRNEFRNYIWGMIQTERNLVGPGLNIGASIEWLDQFRTKNPFMPKPIDHETSLQLRKGICCSHCGSFDIDTQKSYVACPCGMHEPRENAIVRTICEYGVIHFDKELRTSELLAFFGGDVSRTNLSFYLNKHFVKIGAGRSSAFINKRRSFEVIKEEFQLLQPKYLKLL